MTTGYLMLDQPNPYTAQGTYPRRGNRGKLTGTCILHTTEGAWTSGVQSLINLVRSRSDYGCYHRACDWQDIALLYPWEWETWQDSETNNWAVGISAACRTSDWAIMPADIREGYYRNMAKMAADFVQHMKTQYGITVPLVRLSGAQARAGQPGFCAHGDSGLHRSDPGANFDWTKFFDYTRQALGGAALAPKSAPKITDPLEEIMSFFKDRAEFSAWMQDQVRHTFKNNPEIARAIAKEVVTHKLQRFTVKNGDSVPEVGKTTTIAKEMGNRNQIDSRILGAVAEIAKKVGVAPEVLAAAIAKELVAGQSVDVTATFTAKKDPA